MLFDTAVESFGHKINAIETQDYKLNVKDLKMDIPHVTSTMQKKLVLEKKDLTAPLKGTVELIHKASGKVVESKHTTLLMLLIIILLSIMDLNTSR